MLKTFTLFICLIFCLKPGGHAAVLPDMVSGFMHPAGSAAWDLSADTVTGQDLSGDKSELRLRVFPNPATDFIRIEWQLALDMEIHAELYDLFGRRVSQVKAGESDNHIQIDLQSFQRSAYLLKVFTPDGKFSRTYRIVKH